MQEFLLCQRTHTHSWVLISNTHPNQVCCWLLLSTHLRTFERKHMVAAFAHDFVLRGTTSERISLNCGLFYLDFMANDIYIYNIHVYSYTICNLYTLFQRPQTPAHSGVACHACGVAGTKLPLVLMWRTIRGMPGHNATANGRQPIKLNRKVAHAVCPSVGEKWFVKVTNCRSTVLLKICRYCVLKSLFEQYINL